MCFYNAAFYKNSLVDFKYTSELGVCFLSYIYLLVYLFITCLFVWLIACFCFSFFLYSFIHLFIYSSINSFIISKNLWNLYLVFGNPYTHELCSLSFHKTLVKKYFIQTSNAIKCFKKPKLSQSFCYILIKDKGRKWYELHYPKQLKCNIGSNDTFPWYTFSV